MEKHTDPDLLCIMFVRALLIDSRNPSKPNKTGPTHAPVAIYEDLVVNLDDDILKANYDNKSN